MVDKPGIVERRVSANKVPDPGSSRYQVQPIKIPECQVFFRAIQRRSVAIWNFLRSCTDCRSLHVYSSNAGMFRSGELNSFSFNAEQTCSSLIFNGAARLHRSRLGRPVVPSEVRARSRAQDP